MRKINSTSANLIQIGGAILLCNRGVEKWYLDRLIICCSQFDSEPRHNDGMAKWLRKACGDTIRLIDRFESCFRPISPKYKGTKMASTIT